MKKIFLFTTPLLLVLIFSFITNNNFKITGTVTDTKGQPIAFVSITVKGTSNAVTSDVSGNYAINSNNENGTLMFSIVGYNKKEIKINKQHVINAVLERNTQELQSVVVTALGAVRQKAAIGYSSQTITANTLYPVGTMRNAVADKSARGNYDGVDDIGGNTEGYGNIVENNFRKVTDEPLSTFSIDVDAASYSNVRRFLNDGQLPPAGAVRIEEMINYFKYDYPAPADKQPFSITTEMSDCPWNNKNKLLMIGLQGKQIPVDKLPATNLVFLIDVSGSMSMENKLPLVKTSLKMLADQLREKDKISIVVYAGNAGLVLPSTNGYQKQKIKDAIDALEAGGSTAGGAGIKLAYKIAKENFVEKGNNRVILCTDGDFNVGASSDDEMVRLIEKERESGVFLTVLGYGTGNYQDSKMQQLADKGNGNHAYIDGLSEAKKVLVNEFGGTLFTIAKDVKLQVEFNPAKIAGYRLIGYENRILNKEDFKDDKKDAGELGSGHTVTALYEIIPAGVTSEFLKDVDPLKYQQKPNKEMPILASDELLTIKFRYKDPAGSKSELIEHPVKGITAAFSKTSDNFRFAAAVAGFGMLLRNSQFKGNNNYAKILEYGNASIGQDKEGYRKEFISLVKKASNLANKTAREDHASR
ncbi:MAG: von Willebrand factor type A domain-containing protein [Ferruginibacter sp.]